METTRFDAPDDVVDAFGDLFAEHWNGREFFNPWKVGKGSHKLEKPKVTDLLKWQLGTNPWKAEKRTERPVGCREDGLQTFLESDARAKILWMGHASFLVDLDGFRCLIDPVFGTVGAFVKRFGEQPFELDAVPDVDAVFLSHGHYDHLDVQTLDALAKLHPDALFCLPEGQQRYLPRSCGHVHRVDWWDHLDFGGVSATFVPAQHWHRRGLFDFNTALWGGWVLGGSRTIFHCGDSGYFDGFRALSRLFEVDCAMLPVGAYEPRWFMKDQHMNPEEALQTLDDLNARQMIAMHWGTYDLTDEPRNRGAEVVRQLAEERSVTERVHVVVPGDWRAV